MEKLPSSEAQLVPAFPADKFLTAYSSWEVAFLASIFLSTRVAMILSKNIIVQSEMIAGGEII
jgi:hypothetical protein